MPVSPDFSRATGAFFRNIRGNLRWAAAELSKQHLTQMVVNPAGAYARARVKAFLHWEDHDENGRVIKREIVGHAYECDDGHEYYHDNRGTYRFDPVSNSWKAAS